MARAAGGSSWRVTAAGRPPQGQGWLVEPLADGRLIVAFGCASQSGWDVNYELADPLLRILVTAAAGPGLEHGYAQVVVALRELAEGGRPYEDGCPLLTAIVAVCSSRGIELSWAGVTTAYLVRGREIVAGTAPTPFIRPDGCMPGSLQFDAFGLDEAVVLVPMLFHRQVGFRAGVERALRAVGAPEAIVLDRELCKIVTEHDETVNAYAGPLMVIRAS